MMALHCGGLRIVRSCRLLSPCARQRGNATVAAWPAAAAAGIRQPQRTFAQLRGEEHGPDDAARRLLAGLHYEAEHGYQNVQGKHVRFADFAQREAAALAQALAARQPPAAPAPAPSGGTAAPSPALLQAFAGRLATYESLKLEARRQLVDSLGDAARQMVALERLQQRKDPAHASGSGEASMPAAPAVVASGSHVAATGAVAKDAPGAALEVEPEAHGGAGGQGAGAEAGVHAPLPGMDAADGEEYVLHGKKRVKASTLAFREAFRAAALRSVQAASGSAAARLPAGFEGEQRSAAWHELRDRRLTASAFANALGFFSGGRQVLWEEKLGLRPRFAGNAATAWGSSREESALEMYRHVTGHEVQPCMFEVKHNDEVHGWIGASPDGLIAGLLSQQTGGRVAGQGANIVSGPGAGIVEAKCPWNKGRPDDAQPPKVPAWYYMPQAQGLMDVFDREWCNMWVWTHRNGAVLFHVSRDRSYWRDAFEVLAEFWWGHVVPARMALEEGNVELAESFRPSAMHPKTQALIARSKAMARAAARTYYPPETCSNDLT